MTRARLDRPHQAPFGSRRLAGTLTASNCGELTGGMRLLPDALFDDGQLDVATVSPESLTQWVGVAARVLANRADGPALERVTGCDVTVRVDPPQLCEVDGDVLAEASTLRFVLQADALVVRVGDDDLPG